MIPITSEKAVNTTFYVPNTASGKEFIKEARGYLNRATHRLRLMGRGPGWRRRAALPMREAQYFAIYLDAFVREEELSAERHQHLDEVHQLRTDAEVNQLNHERQLRVKDEIIAGGLRREKEADRVIEKLVKERDDALVKTWGTVWHDVVVLIHRWWLK